MLTKIIIIYLQKDNLRCDEKLRYQSYQNCQHMLAISENNWIQKMQELQQESLGKKKAENNTKLNKFTTHKYSTCTWLTRYHKQTLHSVSQLPSSEGIATRKIKLSYKSIVFDAKKFEFIDKLNEISMWVQKQGNNILAVHLYGQAQFLADSLIGLLNFGINAAQLQQELSMMLLDIQELVESYQYLANPLYCRL